MNFLTVTARHHAQRNRVKAARERMVAGSYELEGVFYWAANDRPIPVSVFNENFVEVTEAQRDANDEWVASAVAEARANDRAPDGHELGEMRHAFGEGRTVINVVTGRVTKL